MELHRKTTLPLLSLLFSLPFIHMCKHMCVSMWMSVHVYVSPCVLFYVEA